MGGGKGSNSTTTTVQLTPEQRETIAIQNAALRDTFLPTYKNTLGTAGSLYNNLTGATTGAANNALGVLGGTGAIQGAAGAGSLVSGLSGLTKLFSDDYKNQQIQAAMQPAREDIREQIGSQNAMFGGAGGAGDARYALARENLSQLGEQRLATAAAQASAGVEANRATAAQQLAGLGMQGLSGAQSAALQGITAAQSPMDLYSKYASVVFGVPQGQTTPNYAGTQGGTSSGSAKSSGFRLL